MADDQAKVKTMDSRHQFLRKCFQNVVVGLESQQKQLNADKESFQKSVEERLKQVEEKVVLEEQRFLHEKDIRDLDLRRKELGSIEEEIQGKHKNLNEKEELLQVEEKRVETMKKHIKERFLEVSQREKILDLKREELLGKEEELAAKQTLLEAREKVLGSRCEQLLAREKQLELRESILNVQNEEKTEKEINVPEHSRNKNRKRAEIDSRKAADDFADTRGKGPSRRNLAKEKKC